MTDEQRRRIDDHRPAVGLQWDENNPPPRVLFERPEQWTILLTSSNHGLVGAYGHTFPHAENDHERINVVDEAVVVKLRERIRELEAAGNTNKAVLTDEKIDIVAARWTKEDGDYVFDRDDFHKCIYDIEAAVLSNASKAAVTSSVTIPKDVVIQAWNALNHALTICDAVPSRAQTLPEGEPLRHLGVLVNFDEDTGAHGYAMIRDAASALHDAICRTDAAPAPADNPSTAGAAQSTLDKICDLFGIGSLARSESTILANVCNVIRREKCLSAVENEFFMVPAEPDEDFPDEDPGEECLLGWGRDPEQYVDQFRAAISTLAAPAINPSDVRDKVLLDSMDAWIENNKRLGHNHFVFAFDTNSSAREQIAEDEVLQIALKGAAAQSVEGGDRG